MKLPFSALFLRFRFSRKPLRRNSLRLLSGFSSLLTHTGFLRLACIWRVRILSDFIEESNRFFFLTWV